MMFKQNDKITVIIPEHVKAGFSINGVSIPNDLILDIKECPVRTFVQYDDREKNLVVYRKDNSETK